MSMKNSDTFGNQTHDLPGFSAVSPPTAAPRAPIKIERIAKYIVRRKWKLRKFMWYVYLTLRLQRLIAEHFVTEYIEQGFIYESLLTTFSNLSLLTCNYKNITHCAIQIFSFSFHFAA
jgi:hypothetical protein